ncbi:sensor histidine kinase [Streptomyces roseus]|uniref:sensor histidine kinase n=1 Tax=Streptomyces roseus TaxID=66430 RepID=UPI0036C788C5
MLTTILGLSGGFAVPGISGALQDDAFFIIPCLAAFQMARARVATVAIVTAVAYVLCSSLVEANDLVAWRARLLEALFIGALGAGCAWLAHLQRSRVDVISALAADRSRLTAQVMTESGRERRLIAEALHDGPLQTALAAALDLDEARFTKQPQDFDRVERALRETAAQLRNVVTELHPEVLEHAGLGKAVCNAAKNAAQRGAFTLSLDVDTQSRYPQAHLLYGVARELLINVVKHAKADRVDVTLRLDHGLVRLEVRDNGVGCAEQALAMARSRGHIGLASHKVRLEEAGGSLTLSTAYPSGTAALVELPLQPVTD